MISLSLSRLRLAAKIGAALVACTLAPGCGGDNTHRVSGNVNFNGKPVPAGKIYFMPDGSKGNQGATGFADIKDGRYDTSSTGGRGCVSGALIVAIEGQDPSAPGKASKDDPEVQVKTLFPRYETTMDVSGDTQKDFEVPADAAKGPKVKGPAVVVP